MEADADRASMELMGYKAMTFETSKLNAIGMPVGWDASDSNVEGAEVDERGWWWREGVPR